MDISLVTMSLTEECTLNEFVIQANCIPPLSQGEGREGVAPSKKATLVAAAKQQQHRRQ